MRPRPLLAAFCLLLAVSGAPAATALAQSDGGAGLSDLEKALSEQTQGAPSTTSPAPETDDAQPPAITDDPAAVAPPAGTSPAPAAGTAVPVPPPYLQPGQSAGIQPIAAVAELEDPDLPLEPVRLAALIAVGLATLLLALAALLRSLGVRTAITAAAPVVSTAPPGPMARLRGRGTRLADDVRDFLRHSR